MKLRFILIVAAAIAISALPNLSQTYQDVSVQAQINSAEQLLKQGKNYYDANQFDAALSSFQQALKIYQTNKE